MSKTYLLRLETDADANPSLDVLRKIADALDVTVADLLGAPATRFVADEADVPPSLRIFADEQNLSPRDFEQLASIRWRKGEVPTSSERWRFILQSLQASRQFDDG
jgi:transcriptional regulator with XRE-family HTH domain